MIKQEKLLAQVGKELGMREANIYLVAREVDMIRQEARKNAMMN